MSNRREFITLLGGAATAWPLMARAQQPDRVRRIGVLINTVDNDPDAIARLSAFKKALRELGWDEGRNLQIDTRLGVDDDRIRRNAAELIALAPLPTSRARPWCSNGPTTNARMWGNIITATTCRRCRRNGPGKAWCGCR
jgi:hypothetical protein